MTTQTRIRPDKMRRMARPAMIQKTYRVRKALYEAAMAKAERQQESLSDVIRAALEEYACTCSPSDRLGAQGGHGRPDCPAGR